MLLQTELSHLSSWKKGDSAQSRLLKLSLAEAYMREALHDDAEKLFLEIGANQTIASDLTRVGRLRLCIGLAGILHLRFQ